MESLRIPDINLTNSDNTANPKKTPGLSIVGKSTKTNLKKRCQKEFKSTVSKKYPISSDFKPINSDIPSKNLAVNDTIKMPIANRLVGAVIKLEIPKKMLATFLADDVKREYLLKVS